jgi:hypothetical protein
VLMGCRRGLQVEFLSSRRPQVLSTGLWQLWSHLMLSQAQIAGKR